MRSKPPLQCIEVGEPFECIGMDIKEFDVSTKGNRYALVFQDCLTKWPEVYLIPDHQARTVADCLADLIWRHGAPEFLCDVLQNAAALFGLEQLLTTGGHPQTDGLKGSDRDTKPGPVLMAYRKTPRSSTGVPPFCLLHGRDAKIPSALDFYVSKPPVVTVESANGRELFQELKRVRNLARQNIRKAPSSQKRQYDRHAKATRIKEGNLVMLKVDTKFKLEQAFRSPYKVHKVTSTCACIQPVSRPDQEQIFVSLQRLSKCEGTCLEDAQPWFGHGLTRRCHQVRARRVTEPPSVDALTNRNSTTSSDSDKVATTRSGCRVTKLAGYRDSDSCPEESAPNRGRL